MRRAIFVLVVIAFCEFCGPLLAAPKFASIDGSVGDGGNPIKNATVKIFRYNRPTTPSYGVAVIAVARGGFAGGLALPFAIDALGTYRVKTDKVGHYRHDGLPPGTYAMAVEVDGVILELVSGVKLEAGKTTSQNFDVTQDRPTANAVSAGSVGAQNRQPDDSQTQASQTQESAKPELTVTLPSGSIILKKPEIFAGMLWLRWTGEVRSGPAEITLTLVGEAVCEGKKREWRKAVAIYVPSVMGRDDLSKGLEDLPQLLRDCSASVSAMEVVAVKTEPETSLDKLMWETKAISARIAGRQEQLAAVRAAERSAQQATCDALYASIANKKMSDLTVSEDAARKKCQEAGFNPR